MIPSNLFSRQQDVPARRKISVAVGWLFLLANTALSQDSQFGFDPAGNLTTQATESPALPQILAQPQPQLVGPGESASFIVVPADVSGLAYQWRFNGTNLPGDTDDTLLLNNVSHANEGPYSVVLANASGSVTSLVTQLYIDSRGVGMPDSWQLAYFGNLNQNPTGDFDRDGVNNLQEFLDGTNPTNAASALYRITLFNDGGTVVAVPDQSSYTNGQVVTLTASGSASAPFHAWTGDVVTRSNAITVTMNTNLTLFAHFQPLTLNWTNTFSGDWNVASNWFPNLVPGSNESVVIVLQVVVVTLNGNADLRDLTLGGNNNGPELRVAGRLTIAGAGTWQGGTMSGSGTTVVLPGASLNIISVTTPTLNGRTLENAGKMSWMGGNLFIIGGVITNDAGAQFAVEGSGSFFSGGGAPRFDNAGTLVTATNDSTVFGVAFNNYGTVTIQGGTFSMEGGGMQVGNMPVPAGTTVNFAGGTFTSSNSLSITGAGTLTVSGGTSTLGGTVNVTGSNIFSGGSMDFTGNYTCVGNTVLDISGGTVSFDGNSIVAPNTVNLNGSLGGANTVTVGSVMNWTGGSMSGSGQTIIRPGATLNIAGFTGYGGVFMFDRTLENAGTVVWGGGNLGLSGVITNDAGASFQVQGTAAFNSQGGSPRFDNAGTFLPAPGGTNSFNAIAFNNYGAINLGAGGLLSLRGGGLQWGPVTVPTGATINYAGGTFNASAGSSITGAGTLQVSGGTANLAGIVNVIGANLFTAGTANLTGNYTCVGNTALNIAGGTANFDGTGTVAPQVLNLNGVLGGANTVTVGSAMNWTGGTMDGSGQTIIKPGATLSIAGFAGYGGVGLTTRTLENAGTTVWGGGNLNMNNCIITNDAGASFQVQGTAAFNYQGGSPRFDNAGTFLPAPGGTYAFHSVAFNNYGAINLGAGALLSLGGGGAQWGPVTVPTGATIDYAAGIFNASAGSSITGAGTLQVSGGTANLAGIVNVTGANLFTAGTANLTGNYTCVGNTLLNIAGGTANFDGTGTVAPQVLNLNGVLGGANTVTVGSAMNWTGGTMDGSGQTIIKPGATLSIAGFAGYGGVGLTTRTLENGGTAVWGGGNLNMNSCIITNDAGASFQVQGTAAFNYQGGSPRFDNAGTFLPSRTGTTGFYSFSLNNYGAINLDAGGRLLLEGGYLGASNSVVNYAIDGKTPGTNFAQIQAPGALTLNGTLNVNLTNHYVPTTNDSFTLVSVGTRDGAFANFTYSSNNVTMVLSNTTTSVIIRVASVALQQTALSVPEGIISWWRAESNALDSVGTNNGALTNGVSYTAGEVGQSFLLDGTSGYVVIPDSPSLEPVSVTLEAWVKIFSTNGIQLIFAKPLGSGTFDSYGLALSNGAPLAAICDTNGFGTFLSITNMLTLGQWYHLAYTYDGTSGQEALYVNGAAVASANAGKSMNYDAHPLLLGADIENGAPSYFLDGQIDEATIYNRALGANEIASIYNVGSLGKALPFQLTLYMERIGPTSARLYWSTNSPLYHLQYNTSVGTTNWAATGLIPVVTGADFVVTNSLFDEQGFYRLSQ
jgi:hypothetical protein